MSKKQVVIVGGGPAGLMAASQLIDSRFEVILIDQKPTIGRKFLVAGDGGFNLSHSEPTKELLEKYDNNWIKNIVQQFDGPKFREFLSNIGIPTIVGSSGKVFPEENIKPIDVLNAWKKYLSEHITIQTSARFIDFTANEIRVEVNSSEESLKYDYLILALGGGSWSKTGSDGKWVELFGQKEIDVVPFKASNSGVVLYENWLGDLEGKILKNIVSSVGTLKCAGDIVCTSYGLEGKPVYAVNRGLRDQEKPQISIDFKPQMAQDKIEIILKKAKNPSQGLKELKLGEVAIFWLKNFVSKEKFMNPKELAKAIKHFAVAVKGFRDLEEVISTAGGVSIEELSSEGELIKFPRVFCAGEMINWDAPTGGYLIQGCVASGYTVGNAISATTKGVRA